MRLPKIYLVRHGETEWSLSGRHTSTTDVALTPRGQEQARRLGEMLRSIKFAQVWSSPLGRARRTCELAGVATAMTIDDALSEWNYGEYEGITTAEIRKRQPAWNLFENGCPGGGESPAQVSARADQMIAKLRAFAAGGEGDGNIAIFSHGHFLRSLAARWIRLPVREGQRLMLHTASLSVLSFEHDAPDEPAILLWNEGLDH